MGDFNSSNGTICNVDDLHRCGNTACFVGYLALTDEYKAFVTDTYKAHITDLHEIRVDYDGTIANTARFGNSSEDYLSKFLGIDEDIAHAFIYGSPVAWDKNFYPVDFEKVKPQHVIEKLEELKLSNQE